MIYGVTKKKEVAESWEKNNVILPILRAMAGDSLSPRLREYAEKKLKAAEIFSRYDHFYYLEILCEGKPRWVKENESISRLVWEVERPT